MTTTHTMHNGVYKPIAMLLREEHGHTVEIHGNSQEGFRLMLVDGTAALEIGKARKAADLKDDAWKLFQVDAKCRRNTIGWC